VTQLPRDAWDKEQASSAAQAILAWAKTVPAEKRTAQDFIEVTQVGNEMASMLPGPESARIRKELLSLSVHVFVVKTVREQMRFDTTRLVVEAGKPFEVIFENLDMMPHNFVLVQPGAREEVGLQAQSMSPVPDWRGRVYVPDNKKIIASSKLLEAGQKDRLQLTAPEKPGSYEYLCSYPEHYKTMFGELVVVKDLAEFLSADVPPAAPRAEASAAAPLHQHNH
jgi:azurin